MKKVNFLGFLWVVTCFLLMSSSLSASITDELLMDSTQQSDKDFLTTEAMINSGTIPTVEYVGIHEDLQDSAVSDTANLTITIAGLIDAGYPADKIVSLLTSGEESSIIPIIAAKLIHTGLESEVLKDALLLNGFSENDVNSILSLSTQPTAPSLSVQIKNNATSPSSEVLINAAWKEFVSGDYTAALGTTQQLVDLYSVQGRQQNQEKGAVIVWDGSKEKQEEIFSYGALNDVAAAYFIQGEIYVQQDNTEQAVGVFKSIVNDYNAAQVWDPQGWFWGVAESVETKYSHLVIK